MADSLGGIEGLWHICHTSLIAVKVNSSISSTDSRRRAGYNWSPYRISQCTHNPSHSCTHWMAFLANLYLTLQLGQKESKELLLDRDWAQFGLRRYNDVEDGLFQCSSRLAGFGFILRLSRLLSVVGSLPSLSFSSDTSFASLCEFSVLDVSLFCAKLSASLQWHPPVRAYSANEPDYASKIHAMYLNWWRTECWCYVWWKNESQSRKFLCPFTLIRATIDFEKILPRS
jgi:hypothetical protein